MTTTTGVVDIAEYNKRKKARAKRALWRERHRAQHNSVERERKKSATHSTTTTTTTTDGSIALPELGEEKRKERKREYDQDRAVVRNERRRKSKLDQWRQEVGNSSLLPNDEYLDPIA